ncbi:MAG: hypothetical protein Q7U63_02730 [Polaromonas sp.]|uniref:hypothetical protein n=1 Tax=Polaromonas sp. TaxID=1869339 RepID=UPI0027213D96|nr:hypothetical protein [Polaromonas sp.]MDO9112689.1 hypothetical protein [Polaromonas sp.]
MTAEQRSKEPAETPEGSTLPSPSRRRLVRGAAGSAGVLLSVHAKTALGTGVCRSPSATMSGNTSPRPGSGITCSGGRSPGFWKVPQKFNYWAGAGAVPPTFTVPVNECATGMQNLVLSKVATQGTLLTSAGFTGAPAGVGLWAVMAFPNSFQGGQLMRHLSAAWLNAGYFTSAGAKYPLTKQQVIDMWNATKGGGTYCPSSLTGCGTSGWSSAQVISYISGMYDINSGVEPDLCTP